MSADVANAEARQTAIYRAMPPEKRLAQAVRMNRQMRALMDAGLHQQKPEWSGEERRREIARRILHAATG
ncbi:MAG: hypothetical protein WC205_12145 [Opitutaceae bacterium]